MHSLHADDCHRRDGVIAESQRFQQKHAIKSETLLFRKNTFPELQLVLDVTNGCDRIHILGDRISNGCSESDFDRFRDHSKGGTLVYSGFLQRATISQLFAVEENSLLLDGNVFHSKQNAFQLRDGCAGATVDRDHTTRRCYDVDSIPTMKIEGTARLHFG